MHRLQVPGAGGDGGGLGALRRSGAAPADGGDAGGQRLVHLRGRQEVHVHVDRARGEDPALAGDDVGGRADDEVRVDAVGDVGVAGAAERDDPAVAEPDVGLDDAPVVEDHGVGDDGVRCALGPRRRGLGHRLADRLAAAEDGLLAAEGQVLLDLDPEVGVAEPDLVARRSGRRARRSSRRVSSAIGRTCALSDLDARDDASAAERDDGTSRDAPGSNRRDVPDGMSSRNPCAASRSNSSAALASGRWRCEPIWTGRSPVLTMTRVPRSSAVRSALISSDAVGEPERARTALPLSSSARRRWGRGW